MMGNLPTLFVRLFHCVFDRVVMCLMQPWENSNGPGAGIGAHIHNKILGDKTIEVNLGSNSIMLFKGHVGNCWDTTTSSSHLHRWHRQAL